MTRHRAQHRVRDPLPAIARAGNVRPLVAVVGRPNVGKSTLFNRLAGRRIAIVHDQPGVTRDRTYADAFSMGVEYTLVDTGGFDPESDDPMQQGIGRQVQLAIEAADVIVCVFDGTIGPTDADRQAVGLLRKSGKPIVYAANKVDSNQVAVEAADIYRIGVPELHAVSALHGRGIGELEEAILAHFPPDIRQVQMRERRARQVDRDEAEFDEDEAEAPAGDEDDDEVDERADLPKVALIGRPNAGKSSLLNRLTGEERALVDSRPGTTRDTVDAVVKWTHKTDQGSVERDIVFLDTAGIRRKSKVEETIESLSVLRAIRAIERADVVVLLCDAAEGVAEQDAKILGLAVERGRGVVIGLNKCDLLSAEEQKKAEEQARDKLSFVPWAPIVRMSGQKGRGVNKLIETAMRVRESWTRRVSTGELNRFFEQVLETHPPPTMGGRAVRLYYVTQAETRPPTFVVVTNEPDNVHFSYQRYVSNRIRETFAFEGTPLRLRFRPKRRKERGERGAREDG